MIQQFNFFLKIPKNYLMLFLSFTNQFFLII